MRQTDLACIGQHGCIDFVISSDHNINQAQGRTKYNAESTSIVPLVGTKIDIQHHCCACLASRLSSKERRTAARLLTQTCAGNQQYLAFGDRGCQDIVDGECDIGAVLTVVGQWEAIWWFDAQHDCAGTPTGFDWGETCFYSFLPQKMQDKVAYLVISDSCEERRTKAQTSRANADICGTATNISGKTA